MAEMKYPHLFQPIVIGKTVFRNRIFASPTGVLDMTTDNFPTEEAAAYYELKALGGAACVTIGDSGIDPKYGLPHQRQINLYDPDGRGPLVNISRAITRHGAVASAELQHGGMYSIFSPEPYYGPVETELPDGRVVREMPESVIEEIISRFGDAAAWVKACGFGMVMLHGGHGWLLNQFLSPTLNRRKDRWGGAFENRMRLTYAVIDEIRRRCGRDFPIEFRMSGSECNPNGYDIDEGVRIAQALDGKVDIIHVSAGHHEIPEVFYVTHPTMFLPDGVNVKYAAEIKKHVKTPVACVGAMADPAYMEEIIASGQADIVNLARALIADPYLPRKAREGRDAEIRQCMRCFACYSMHVTQGHYTCAINPAIGVEREMKYQLPPAEKKKVLVVGGGVGGMQAALESARRGHEVILCEKSGVLGGTLRCEERVPFKQRLGRYLDQQAKAVSENPNIDLRMNTEVTAALAESLAPDVIIAALGARPIKPDLEGIDRENVLGAEYAYMHIEEVGQKVVILGGGLVGQELGIYLAREGRDVTILEMRDTPDPGENRLHVRALGYQLKDDGVKLELSTKALAITEKGVRAESADGERFYEADTVIYAVGQKPLWEQADALRFVAKEFHQIGDCLSPRTIRAATSEAFHISRDLGVEY